MAGFRFFKMSYADANRKTANLTITSNDAMKIGLVNRDPLFIWQSIGSDDSTPVVFTVDFGTSRTIDSFILTNTNLKGFLLEYLNGSNVWTTLLSETANVATTYFKQFAPVTCQQIRLTMNTTMTANAEKTIQDFIITQQIGQLTGYPGPNFTNNNGNSTKKKMINGKEKFILSGFARSFKLNFQDHVGNPDRDLFTTLVEMVEPVLVWASGGNETQFLHADPGYRLQDIYLMNVDNGYSHKFTGDLYCSGFTAPLTFTETT